MKSRVAENFEAEYKCGKCGTTVAYKVSTEAPDCPECGWKQKEESQYNIPKSIKFQLHK